VTLEQFKEVAKARVPSPAELVALVGGLGWRVDVEGGRAALRVPDATDRLAVALARMLGREPYRTGVLAEAQRRWRGTPLPPVDTDDAAAALSPPAGEPEPSGMPELLVWRLAGDIGWCWPPRGCDPAVFLKTFGIVGWRRLADRPGEWRPLSELPPEWGFALPEGES